MEFKDLNISKQILMALEEAGFEHPTPIQEQAFPVIRSGRDMIGIAQTGTGKTLAYLIPLLMKLHYAQGMHPRALVIVPTRELVVQVCESVDLLTEFMDIRCIGIYGGTNIRTQQAAVYEGTDLLVATPGRFMDIYMNGMFRTGQIKTVVVDEADRLMDLGFMPQLRSILEVIPAKHQTLLFSATFSETVETMAHEFLTPDPIRIETAIQATPVEFVTQLRYDVPNIATKINLLKLLLADKETFRRVMVFTETKKNADRIVEKLADHWKGELSVLHSNKAQNTRLNALNAFKKGDIIEPLIGQQVPIQPLPENLEISDLLMDEEKVQTSNIVYQRGKPKGGGAFHQRSAKNSKTPQKVRRGNPKKRKQR